MPTVVEPAAPAVRFVTGVWMDYSRTAPERIDRAYPLDSTVSRGPGAPFPPTLFFVIAFAFGWWIEAEMPLISASEVSPAASGSGWTLTIAGAAIFIWGMATFARAGTGIMLQRAATQVVERGPYRWSRNPQYVAFTLIYVGAALAWGLVWPLILLPLATLALTVVIIAREERYMRATFGMAYRDYCRRVRRWL